MLKELETWALKRHDWDRESKSYKWYYLSTEHMMVGIASIFTKTKVNINSKPVIVEHILRTFDTKEEAKQHAHYYSLYNFKPTKVSNKWRTKKGDV